MTRQPKNEDGREIQENSKMSDTRYLQIFGHFPGDLATKGMTIFDMFDVLRANVKTIALVSLGFAIVSATYSLLATPTYRAEILLAPADQQSMQSPLLGQLGGLASLAGVTVGGGGSGEAIAVLKSGDFTQGFIEDQNLMPILFEKDWDATRMRWRAPDPDNWPDIRDGIRRFNRGIRTVQENAATGLVRVSINWRDGEVAAIWANSMIDRLNEHLRQRALAEATRNIEYLQAELAKTNVVTLQQSIGSLLERDLQRLMLARGSDEFVFRVIDRARAPKDRSHPKRTLITILGFSVGFIFAVISVLVLDGFRQRSGQSEIFENDNSVPS